VLEGVGVLVGVTVAVSVVVVDGVLVGVFDIVGVGVQDTAGAHSPVPRHDPVTELPEHEAVQGPPHGNIGPFIASLAIVQLGIYPLQSSV
jgi:hypothetical protein